MKSKIPEIVINKSWFYTAGDKYGWSKDGLDPRGVGIAKPYLVNNKELIIVVDDIKYQLYTLAGVESNFYTESKLSISFDQKISHKVSANLN